MSSHEKLSAAANDRKARLAQLKSLKRKQAPTDDTSEDVSTALTTTSTDPTTASPSTALTATEEPSVTSTYLSGRNYDPATRNVKLGFDALPIADPTSTLEYKAEQLALSVKTAQEKEREEDKGLDLFKLQPKKPNWDLKRDLGEKMRGLEVQTDNAIAKLVRERVESQKGVQNGDGEKVGMEGRELVEVMHLKEKEEEEERRREREDEDVS
jgi:coiled-coil domain-containing protein 12